MTELDCPFAVGQRVRLNDAKQLDPRFFTAGREYVVDDLFPNTNCFIVVADDGKRTGVCFNRFTAVDPL